MNESLANFIPIIVGIISGAITNGILQLLTKLREESTSKKRETQRVKMEYLNALRIYATENLIRMKSIQKILSESDIVEPLTCVDNALTIRLKDKEWFYKHGCFLVSTGYLVSCLFSQMYRIRLYLPASLLKASEYERIITLTHKLSRDFRQHHAVYHILQYDIGQNMYRDGVIISYSEFCTKIHEAHAYDSTSQLLDLLIDIGQNNRKTMLYGITSTLSELVTCLDKALKMQSITDTVDAS